jgi:hypothetical protein
MTENNIKNPTNSAKPVDSARPTPAKPTEGDGGPGKVAAARVMERLRKAKRMEGARPVISGREIEDPGEALERFERALEMVRHSLAEHGVQNIEDDVIFTQFAGNMVGESTAEGIEIDSIMLMHPAARLARVIAHEWAHQGGEIQNEGLVDYYVAAVLGSSDVELPTDYQQSVDNFEKFAIAFDEDNDRVRGAKKIYELYRDEKYEEIYSGYINKVKGTQLWDDQGKENIIKFFGMVFPELKYTDKGTYEVQPKVEQAKLTQRLDAEEGQKENTTQASDGGPDLVEELKNRVRDKKKY